MLIIPAVFILSLAIATCSAAWPNTTGKGPALGWQFSRPASGFSLKIPYKAFYLQPIFGFSMTKTPDSTNGHFSLGIRGIYNLTPHSYVQPYAGVSWGHSEDFSGTSVSDSKIVNGGSGYETFFGVEYQKYLLRPALEIGMGNYKKIDNNYYAGVVCNFSVLYYF